MLGALSFLLSGGGVAQLGTIVEELNHVMSGREDRLRVLLGSLEDVVGTLDAQKADIIRALEAMNNLTATLNAERQTITDALDATGPAIKVLADQHDELVDMLGVAGPARRRRHPGHPGQQARPDQDPGAPAARC